MENIIETRLFDACRRLRLGENFAKNAKKTGAKTNLDFLLKLLTAELEERDRKRRNAYQKSAKFDILKTFENYKFEDIKFPKPLTADDITRCNFIPKHENLILYGTVGAGKTYLAIATGIAACNAGFKVRYWSTPRLVNALVEAKKAGELSRFLKAFEKLDLLICDYIFTNSYI